MRFGKSVLLAIAMVMLFSTSVFAAPVQVQDRTPNEKVEIDFSQEGRNVDVLNVATGELVSYDDKGTKITTFLTPEQVASRTGQGEVGLFDYDTGLVNITVPKNINGNQGALVGFYDTVAPHSYVNLHIISLPQTTMPTINVAFTNGMGDDTAWAANIPEGYVVSMKARYPSESYVARVSTNELYSSIALLRSFTSY
ncbi:hypothetical protein GCM10008014_45280 [Paenibacillus silvae]|uniref:Uncharacterized protein n=1 Tax=Paenibacillus silvae TaxID=1325358 RepID=A0ABQ1ZJI6_9BACL|nr:hypothetical protein [Paenibacillus silvae]GGH65670.1 hypothetical protein GCM10008014_45280 [Paenibacillus silvae]